MPSLRIYANSGRDMSLKGLDGVELPGKVVMDSQVIYEGMAWQQRMNNYFFETENGDRIPIGQNGRYGTSEMRVRIVPPTGAKRVLEINTALGEELR